MFKRRRKVAPVPYRGPVVPEQPVNIDRIDTFRAENFPDAGPTPWLDQPDAGDRIAEREASGDITAQQAEWCRKWIDDGYLILEGFFTDERLDYVWEAYERSISDAVIELPDEPQSPDDVLPGRALNPHFRIEPIEEMLQDPDMVSVIEILMGATPKPFQTISGHKASQQPLHSDTIHMTTYPSGYLVANWIAFEDIDADSGPLAYVPGSHKLPVNHSVDAGITKEEFDQVGYAAYSAKYEPLIANLTEESGLEVKHFHAKRGDVLLWHANLIHGGSKRDNMLRSRKALVCHYFAEGCVCYHDLSGTKAWVHATGGRYPI